jgi:hypothetical protein
MRKRAWCVGFLLLAAAGCNSSPGSSPTAAAGPAATTTAPPTPTTDPPNDPPTPPEQPPDDPPPPTCEGDRFGPNPARLLTGTEYNNTVRDLLGDTTAPGSKFLSPGKVYGYDNNAYASSVSQTMAQDYMDASESLSQTAVSLPGFLPCDPSVNEQACVDQFIDQFGKRAYRRPLDAEEKQILNDVYVAVRSDASFTLTQAIESVVETVLQSPQFLYRVDQGVSGSTSDPNLVKLTQYELATRLSYFLWASMPDDVLFAAADAGQLDTPEQIEDQARRMIADPRAKTGFQNFYRQWLRFDKIQNIVSKDPELFPAFVPEATAYMTEEISRYMDHVVWELDGGVETLFSLTYTFVNGPLAKLYGYKPEPADPSTWIKAQFPAEQRAGLLTLGGWLAAAGHAEQTSPVFRGLFVRNQFMCEELPPPPPDVMVTAPQIAPGSTTRERFAQHSEDPYCASCHVKMDPLGLGLENYDPVGAWRDKEANLPIDATGEVYDGGDLTGPFNGAKDLGQKLSTSQTVKDCMVTQMFRYAHGRGEDVLDKCTIFDLQQEFNKNGSLRELMVSMTTSDAFRYKIAASQHLAADPKGE